jgi:hypothetical protein
MAHLLALESVLFIVPISGSVAFALLVYRFVVRGDEPPGGGSGDGGTKVPLPSAGPDDLARSA